MSFSAYLYNISDDPRSLNKTLGEAIATRTITPTESCDILNPTFILDYNSTYASCNYIHVNSPFDRYYFITDMRIDIGKKIVISCTVDVLQTYKEDITKISTTIVRNEKPSDKLKAPYMPDPNFNIEAGYDYEYKNFPINWFYPNNTVYVLSWIGGAYSQDFILLEAEPADWSYGWGKYYYVYEGEYIPLFNNYPYEAPNYNYIVATFGGVYEKQN